MLLMHGFDCPHPVKSGQHWKAACAVAGIAATPNAAPNVRPIIRRNLRRLLVPSSIGSSDTASFTSFHGCGFGFEGSRPLRGKKLVVRRRAAEVEPKGK
jgi:hypothetical protein